MVDGRTERTRDGSEKAELGSPVVPFTFFLGYGSLIKNKQLTTGCPYWNIVTGLPRGRRSPAVNLLFLVLMVAKLRAHARARKNQHDAVPGLRVYVCVRTLFSIVVEVYQSPHIELDPVHACEHASVSKCGTRLTLSPEGQAETLKFFSAWLCRRPKTENLPT